jgi:NADPH2:quinone reductase
MRAMVAMQHGGPEVLQWQDHPEPEVREHDLLVQVYATSVNPVDCRVRRSSQVPRQFPLILGYDVCGRVVAMGDRAEGFQIGDEVYASPNVFRPGANAEYVAVDSRSAALKPKNLDYASAAVMPLVSLTAWESLHYRARVQSGSTILIHAGAGGVGHIAVQLAKLHGCRVITTAGREESIAFCRETLRADWVISYQQEDMVQVVMELTEGNGCPVVFDTVGGAGFEQSMDCLAVNGQLVTIVPTTSTIIANKLFLKSATLHYEFMGIPTVHNLNPEVQKAMLRSLANLVESGLLRPHIFKQYSLAELAEAHQIQESGHVMGKIAIQI